MMQQFLVCLEIRTFWKIREIKKAPHIGMDILCVELSYDKKLNKLFIHLLRNGENNKLK